MTDWVRIIDRGIADRQESGEPPVFSAEALSSRLVTAFDPDERDPEKLRLMNLCFDALVCIREANARDGASGGDA
jgi:hypothetical protein